MHSPEPWRVVESERCYEKYLDIVDANGDSVIRVRNEDREEGSNIDCHPDTIHRIAACVNACRGIPTEELEDRLAIIRAIASGERVIPRGDGLPEYDAISLQLLNLNPEKP